MATPVKLAGDTLNRAVLAVLFAGSVVLSILGIIATISSLSQAHTTGVGAVAILGLTLHLGQLLFRGSAPLTLTAAGFEKDTWPTHVAWRDVERFAVVRYGRKRRVAYFLKPEVRPPWAKVGKDGAPVPDGYLPRTYGRMTPAQLGDYLERWRDSYADNPFVGERVQYRYPVGAPVTIRPRPALISRPFRSVLTLDLQGLETRSIWSRRPTRRSWVEIAGFQPYIIPGTHGTTQERVGYHLRVKPPVDQSWRRWLRPRLVNPPDGWLSCGRGGMGLFEFVEYLEAWRKYATGDATATNVPGTFVAPSPR